MTNPSPTIASSAFLQRWGLESPTDHGEVWPLRFHLLAHPLRSSPVWPVFRSAPSSADRGRTRRSTQGYPDSLRRFRTQPIHLMDDWVILAPTQWKLRAAIRLVNETLAELHVEQHPDKTLIGRISRGFDFLGYGFTPAGLDAAPQTIEKCVERVSQLYEQGADMIHIGAYVRRWQRWARSGLRDSGEGLAWHVLRLTLRAVVALLLRFVPWLALSPAFACQTIGDAADACQPRDHKS